MKKKRYCSIAGCERKHYSRDYCHRHYWSQYYYPLNRKFLVEYTKKYQRLHPTKSIKSMHKIRFGGLREAVIQRDGERCVMCGMSRTEHKLIFDRDITINHKDHQSFRSSHFDGVLNNDPDNLETLCMRCHGSKDAMKSGKYATYYKRVSAESGVKTY